MRSFLKIVGGGLILLGVLVTAIILFGKPPRGSGFQVFGTMPTPEIALLVLAALCSFNGFLVFMLAFRQRRIGLEWEEALRDKAAKPAREDAESKKALRDLNLKRRVRRQALFNAAAAGMLVLGLASATVIFLTKIGRLLPPLPPDLPRGTISLWLIFVPSTLLGVVAAWLAQEEVIDQITLQKQQFWDENRLTTRQTGTRRRRARFRLRFLEKQTCYESDTPRWTAAHRKRARFRWHF